MKKIKETFLHFVTHGYKGLVLIPLLLLSCTPRGTQMIQKESEAVINSPAPHI